jgi:predicted double-glycine peptidase
MLTSAARPAWRVAVLLLGVIALGPQTALAGDVLGTSGNAYFVKVTSLKEMRFQESFRTTIKQQHDFSCGSAALATLLTHHYGKTVTEQDVFRVMFEKGDQNKIRREGFSLFDIKSYLEINGYQADGFEADLDLLRKAKVPAIVLIQENGYSHFVVIKGVRDNSVLIGDPSAGTRIVPRTEFEAMWKERILFVIRSHQNVAQFNNAAHWTFRLKAPFGDGLYQDTLSAGMLLLPTKHDF